MFIVEGIKKKILIAKINMTCKYNMHHNKLWNVSLTISVIFNLEIVFSRMN